MGEQSTRWTIKIDRQTDIDLRTYLAQQGMKKGDLSKFVEDAVKWRLFDLNLADIRKGFSDLSAEEAEALAAEALAAVRKEQSQSDHSS